MNFLQKFNNFFLPTKKNAYRPGVLGKRSLLFFLGVILATEGFLVAHLSLRYGFEEFLAAVVGAEIVNLTNAERAEAAAQQLTENELLRIAAQAKADDMATDGYFSHVGPDGKEPWAWIAEAGYDYSVAGENLAVRFVDSSDVVRAWMGSPSHKANIVKPVYEEIGVGIAQGRYKGGSATFVVQYFGTPRKVASLPRSEPPAPPQEPISAPELETQEAPEVAGESVTPVLQPSASQASSDSLSRVVTRALAEPRATSTWILSGTAALLVVVLVLAFFIHIQVQPLDLLLRGSSLAIFALFLILLNGQLLSGPLSSPGQGAAVGASGSQSEIFLGGVVISEQGESTERFIVEN